MPRVIHQSGMQLTKKEISYLQKKAWSLNKQIFRILKKIHPQGMTYHEMMKTLEQANGEVNIDSVRRGLTQQTNCKSGLSKYQDKYGRFRLIKTDEKRENPTTGDDAPKIHVYKYNPKFGEPMSHKEIVQKNAGIQMNFHPELDKLQSAKR